MLHSCWRYSKHRRYFSTGKKNVALLFPGQGAQHVGMGQDIYQNFKVAKDVIDECEEVLGVRLRQLMFDGPQNTLTSTANAQPAILCHSIALLRVLINDFEFDIKNCKFAMGHSLGEYTALVATNSISLADAIRLVRLRGEAMQQSTSNRTTSMKALMVRGDHLHDIEELMPRLQRSLGLGEVAEIANINSSSQIVLSGTDNGVKYASSIFHSKGYSGRPLELPVSAPFHCSLMIPAAEMLAPALDQTDFKMPEIDVVSNVTSIPFTSVEEIKSLLKRQVIETVQWKRSMQYAKDNAVSDWIVVGPARVLANIVKKEYPSDRVTSIGLLGDLQII